MVLKIAAAAFSAFFPTQYIVHISLAVVSALVLRAFSQGRRTSRERDLHARTILITGGFTPLGLTLLQSLAERGAHIIALSPHPIESPEVSILISLLRSTTSNEQIFAEQCDLTSPSSIQSFCKRFLTGNDQRLDAIVFSHEYQHVGPFAFLADRIRLARDDDVKERETKSLATFLITTLLLPTLLVAPAERDIRIVNVVNPFYAAAAGPSLSSASTAKAKTNSVFLLEGTRALRLSILTRHLQRILDALPSAQVPKTDNGTSTVPVVSPKAQKSNIVAVSVSPGISRADTIAPLFNADWTSERVQSSRLGIILYILLQPLLWLFTKSSNAAIQSVLHVLFLPTPFKVLAKISSKSTAEKNGATSIDDEINTIPEEVLKPGALYSECAVVNLKLSVPSSVAERDSDSDNERESRKGKEKESGEEAISLPDDGELGGELAGRLVWEAFEKELKAWEKASPVLEKTAQAPDTDSEHS